MIFPTDNKNSFFLLLRGVFHLSFPAGVFIVCACNFRSEKTSDPIIEMTSADVLTDPSMGLAVFETLSFAAKGSWDAVGCRVYTMWS